MTTIGLTTVYWNIEFIDGIAKAIDSEGFHYIQIYVGATTYKCYQKNREEVFKLLNELINK